MANQVHLIIHSDRRGVDNLAAELSAEQPVSWFHVVDGKLNGNLKQGSLEQFKTLDTHDELVVYVPGLEVLLTRVNLPAGRRAQLLTALPYALEDNLVDEVDELHCALGPKLHSGEYIAAVVKTDIMQAWTAHLANSGLFPRRLVPDMLLLPFEENSWTVHCEQDWVWIRSGQHEGFSCAASMAPFLLQQAFNSTTPRPEKVLLSHCEHSTGKLDNSSLQAMLDDTPVESLQLAQPDSGLEPRLDLLMQYGIQLTSLNLLQGDFAPQSRMRQQLRPWYTAAALAAVWLVIGVVTHVAEFYSLRNQNAQMDQHMAKVYRQAFPTSKLKKGENAYNRMSSDMKRLRGSGDGGGAGFSELMTQLAPVAAKHEKAHFTQLRFRKGAMELMLEIPDLQSLDALKQSLSEATDWNVEIKSANSTDNKVQGRIVISRS